MNNKKVWYAPNKFESYGQEEITAVTKCLEDGFLLGSHHGMTIDDVDYVCDKIKEFI